MDFCRVFTVVLLCVGLETKKIKEEEGNPEQLRQDVCAAISTLLGSFDVF